MELKKYYFEIGKIRPPSEGGDFSLLLRIVRNCYWNRCKFCYGSPYNREPFSLRSVEELKEEIDVVKEISEEIKRKGGMFLQVDKGFPKEQVLLRSECFAIVSNWLASGAKTVFLQDADPPVMKTSNLVEILNYIKKNFPSIERITSYARSKTIAFKPQEELNLLFKAGLSRLHIGLESGDDEILKEMDKGVTSQEHILAGKKAKESGFEISFYVMPGLGGRVRSKEHALNTAKVLNEINPDFIRLRPLVPRVGTPLYKEWQEGKFQLLSPHQLLKEMELMVNNLDITGRLCFDHLRNPCVKVIGLSYQPLFRQDYNGYKFPEEKPKVLELFKKGLKINESKYLSTEELIEMEKDFYKIEETKA